MQDPTYDREVISKNGIWNIAFTISEMVNDMAPIGWSKYVPIAEKTVKEASLGPLPEDIK